MLDPSRARELGLSFGEQVEARLAQQVKRNQIETGAFDRSYTEWLRWWRASKYQELGFLDPDSIGEHLKVTYVHGMALLGVIQEDPVGAELLEEHRIDGLDTRDQHAFRKKVVHFMAHPEGLLGPNAQRIIHFTQHLEHYSLVARRRIQIQLMQNGELIQDNPHLWRSAIHHTMEDLDEPNSNDRVLKARAMVDLLCYVVSQSAYRVILDSDPVVSQRGIGVVEYVWAKSARLAAVEIAAFDPDIPTKSQFPAKVLPMFPNPRGEPLTFEELLKPPPSVSVRSSAGFSGQRSA